MQMEGCQPPTFCSSIQCCTTDLYFPMSYNGEWLGETLVYDMNCVSLNKVIYEVHICIPVHVISSNDIWSNVTLRRI